jgi:hypothetical protein
MTATNEQVFVNGKIFTARNEEEFVSASKGRRRQDLLDR